jgi:hypothetical protein
VRDRFVARRAHRPGKGAAWKSDEAHGFPYWPARAAYGVTQTDEKVLTGGAARGKRAAFRFPARNGAKPVRRFAD